MAPGSVRSVPLAGGGADGDSGGEAHEAEDDRNSASSQVLLPSPCRKPVATAPTAPTPKHELADIRYPGVSIRVGSATLTRRVGRGDKLWRRASGCNSTRLRGLQDVSDRLGVGGGGRVGCELCASDFCASCRLAIFLWHLHMAPPAIGAINRPRCRFRCARGRAALESTFPHSADAAPEYASPTAVARRPRPVPRGATRCGVRPRTGAPFFRAAQAHCCKAAPPRRMPSPQPAFPHASPSKPI